MAVTNNQTILITGPERCGNTSLLAFFSGYNRVTVHHVRGANWKPSVSNFYTHDKKIAARVEDSVKLLKKNPDALTIVLARDPIARVVSDVYHQIEQKEIPPPGEFAPEDYVMMMGSPEDAVFHHMYDVYSLAKIDLREQDFNPPHVQKGLWLLRLRDFDIVPMIAQNEGLDVPDEVPHLNTSNKSDMKFPAPYVNRLLDSEYTKFWFKTEEIEEMRKKWTKL